MKNGMDGKLVPQELVDIHDDSVAAENARDSAVKGFFKFQVRNAVFLGRIAIQKRREFWERIGDLYPELGGKLSYNIETHMVSKLEK